MKKSTYIIVACMLLTACQEYTQQEDSGQSEGTPEQAKMQQVSLTQEKMEMAEIKLGKMKMDVVSDYVECSGTITAPPEKLITMSAPMGGFVNFVRHLPGDYVKKGTLLIKLKHPDYIQLQQDYLDTQSQLEYAIQDYERQKTLSSKEAASPKKYQEATATYKSLQAKLQGLAEQLRFIGINPANLIQKGIQPEISLYAPISGYITEVNVNLGRYVDSQEPLCEILDKSHLHLDLNVYEKDVDKIKVGQLVQFYLNENPEQQYEGRVKLIGQKMEPETKTFDLHVDMVSPPDFLKLGMYARAQILLSADSVATLPAEAIVQEGGQRFVFVKDHDSFRRQEVQTGAQWQDKVEIRNPQDIQGSLLIVDGAYYLQAELEN